MRVCLLTGGGYPYRRDALGGWCRTLVEGLPGVTFDLLTVTDREPSAGDRLRAATERRAGAGGRARTATNNGAPGANDAATAASMPLCRGLLSDRDDADDLFTAGLRRLAGLVPDGGLGPAGRGAADATCCWTPWRTGRSAARRRAAATVAGPGRADGRHPAAARGAGAGRTAASL